MDGSKTGVGDLVVEPAGAHPAESEAVLEWTYEAVCHAEFGFTGNAWMMVHRHFLDFAVLEHEECREESMHSFDKGDSPCVGCVHYFQRATCVGGSISCHHAAETVCEFGLETFPAGVFAVCPDTHDEFVVLEVGDEEVEIFGVRLEVGVDIAYEF